MKFTTALYTFATASAALGAVIERYAPPPSDCNGIFYIISEGFNQKSGDWSPACSKLASNCMLQANSTTYIWSKTSCVAAATCLGVHPIIVSAQCQNNNIPVQNSTSDLSTNIYSNIVHGSKDLSITKQNYIDFMYGALSAINSTTWPTDTNEVIDKWWAPMVEWTATGDLLPYKNLNDFLHYGDY